MGHGVRDLEIQAQAYTCNNRVSFQSGLLMRPNRARRSNSVGNFGLPEMQQFCLCVMLLDATHDIGLCSTIEQ